MSDKLVRDVMHKGVVTCPEDVVLPDAARLMALQSVRALVVTDDQCGLRGILSQSDLVNAKLEYPDPEAWRNVTVSGVMTRSVLTVKPSDTLAAAAKTMVQNHIHRIVVVDDADPCTPVGVLSMGDLVRDMMRD
jgi:CBS domain-containing protein